MKGASSIPLAKALDDCIAPLDPVAPALGELGELEQVVGAARRLLPITDRYDEGRVVSCGLLVLPLKENLHVAWGNVWTHPDHRRQGHGSAMLDHLVGLARERRRSTLMTEVAVPYGSPEDGAGHPDADFALRRGFALDISNVVRVLDLPIDEDQVQRLADEAETRTIREMLDARGLVGVHRLAAARHRSAHRRPPAHREPAPRTRRDARDHR